MWIGFFWKKDVGIIVVVKFERRMASAFIFDIVICEFRYWEKPLPNSFASSQ